MLELDIKTREALEKQLQLLSERSPKASDADLANLTYAMVDVARMLSAKATPETTGLRCGSAATGGKTVIESGRKLVEFITADQTMLNMSQQEIKRTMDYVGIAVSSIFTPAALPTLREAIDTGDRRTAASTGHQDD